MGRGCLQTSVCLLYETASVTFQLPAEIYFQMLALLLIFDSLYPDHPFLQCQQPPRWWSHRSWSLWLHAPSSSLQKPGGTQGDGWGGSGGRTHLLLHPTPSDHTLDQTAPLRPLPFLLLTNMSTPSLDIKGFFRNSFTTSLVYVLHTLNGDLEKQGQILMVYEASPFLPPRGYEQALYAEVMKHLLPPCFACELLASDVNHS